MPLLCLEGASAVGKTTTSKALAAMYGAYVVEEIHFLFKQPPQLEADEVTPWLLARQLDRWKLVQEKLKTHDLVVLDGDHLKMWYSWVYDIDKEASEKSRKFFRNHILNQSIGFPDKYIVLHIDQEQLAYRKLHDGTRKRGGFEKHLRFIEPQKRYFGAMNNYYPDYVEFIEADSIEQNVKKIMDAATRPSGMNPYSVPFFDYMMDWSENNRP